MKSKRALTMGKDLMAVSSGSGAPIQLTCHASHID